MPLVAVITAFPPPAAVMSPPGSTVATDGLLELHVIGWETALCRLFVSAAVALVVSPTRSEAEPNDTDTVATRASSPCSPSDVRSSVPVTLFSVHESMPSIAMTWIVIRSNWRFTVVPMNRATGFSQETSASSTQKRICSVRRKRTVLVTGNAVGTARIYVRQARRSYRH